MKKQILFFCLLTLALTSFSLSALTLKEARSKGLVKETQNGLIKAINSSAAALVKKVNAKRMEHYQKISNKTGTSIDTVAKRAAQKIMKKLSK